MSTNVNILLRATDEASSVVRGASSKMASSLNDIENAGRKVKRSSGDVAASSKEVALAFNNVATSGFALYNAVDRVMDMQVAVDRANLQVKSSLNAVEDAQKRYNDAVKEAGPNSEKALAAQKDLQLAQERYQVACERAEMMQGNLNEAMFQSALTVIPSLITMITSVSTLTKSWTSVTEGVSGALNFLAANPIVLVAAGIAALVAGLVWAYQNCEPFRNAINAIGTALSAVFGPAIEAIKNALVWLWQNVFAPLVDFLVGTFLRTWQNVCDGLTAAWNAFAGGFTWAYEHLVKPIFDGIAWFYNNIIRPVAEFLGGLGGETRLEAGETVGGVREQTPQGPGSYKERIPGAPGRWQYGGIFTKPTLGWIGEAGPEAVIPLSKLQRLGATIQISGPLVNIEGSADPSTARLAAELVEEKLRNVIVEASSSGAPSTHKRIRFARVV